LSGTRVKYLDAKLVSGTIPDNNLFRVSFKGRVNEQ